jgi:hypothetical protein
MDNLEIADELAKKNKKRKTKEEKEKALMEDAQIMKKLLAPTFKIKLCCHQKDMPTVCGIFELPFQPRNGDIICVKPTDDKNEYGRLTFLVNNLIYDIEEGHFTMRPDIIDHMRHTKEKEEVTSEHIDPLDN